MYIRKRTLLCIKVPNRGRRGDFFLSFFFYLSRVQKRSRYGEAVTGTGNNALYRKQNYDRRSPKEEQFLNGVYLKSLISRYKACVKYKTVAVFLCIIVWCNKSKVLKTFRWASNASSSFCCSMHFTWRNNRWGSGGQEYDHQKPRARARASRPTRSARGGDFHQVNKLLHDFVISVFGSSAFSRPLQCTKKQAVKQHVVVICPLILNTLEWHNITSSRVLIFKFPQWFGTEDTHFSGEWEARVAVQGRTPLAEVNLQKRLKRLCDNLWQCSRNLLTLSDRAVKLPLSCRAKKDEEPNLEYKFWSQNTNWSSTNQIKQSLTITYFRVSNNLTFLS